MLSCIDGKERPGVSVIIPTTCEKDRERLLWRSINSVLAQKSVTAEVIIVVNGNHVCDELYRRLSMESMLLVARLNVASLPAAQRHGRGLVSKEYFAFLDDDDELLPGALKDRANILRNDPSIDAVISNGFITYDGVTDVLHVRNFDSVKPDPLSALMEANWLTSCGALFRGRSIPQSMFDGATKYYEWTLLAVTILLAGKKLDFLEKATFRKHEEVEKSLSKSTGYKNSLVKFLQYLLTLDMPRHVKLQIKRKLGRAFHTKAEACRRQGRLGAAWHCHLASVRYPEGWRYLPYTRKLLIPAARSQIKVHTRP